MSFTITIAGTDRTSKVSVGSFRKTDNLNQQVDTCEFVVLKKGSDIYVPAPGDSVVVNRNGANIFGGVILRVDEELLSTKVIKYSVSCVDYSQYLKRKLVTKRYTSTTVAALIADLVSNYTTGADGITCVNANSTQPITSFSFNRLSVADCLQKLADALNFVWYVDYAKDIHFFPKNTELAPFSLSDSSNNYIYNSLKIISDLSQVRNSILVQGGDAVSASSRTETFNGDASKLQFALANKYDHMPAVTVGGVSKTVGTEYLDSDASFQCMWNYNEKYIRFTAGNTPASGTNNIAVSGTYLYPIIVSVPAPASIASLGTYEFAITDASIRSQAEAIDRAQAELLKYQSQLYEGSFKTYNDGLRSGQVLTINSTQRAKNIDVLIQSVECTMQDPLGNTLEYTVRFATMKTIGIIEFLQKQLRSKEVIVDDTQTLLNFIPLTDIITASDSLGAPTSSTGPYVWNTAKWGYSKWA